ncbi:MAG: acyl-CoA dehydrogenase family protein [Actinobacteria bacterium]|nr:acyl-CoA dehydrogenase family protein [Actinomycetota bacterium]
MDLRPSRDDVAFRTEVRDFLALALDGDFRGLRGLGGPGHEHEAIEERRAWEAHLGAHGWTGIGWPPGFGGRALPLHRQVIFDEEYVAAGAPGRLGHIGETLVGPTLIAFGNAEQQRRFLPPILRAAELWCQGYSEPGAGSDLAGVATRAERDGDEWVVTGQKVWTSLAHVSDWCFVLARTGPSAPRHRGLSYLLVPLAQDGVEIRPIVQLTGTSEFNEVFFTGARTAAANVVGAPGDGWKVAMGTLAFERGASTLGQVLAFSRELDDIVATARANGAIDRPTIRQRLADVAGRLRIMRLNALRFLGSDRPELTGAAMVTKLYWATLHRDMGELAADVAGMAGLVLDGDDGGVGRSEAERGGRGDVDVDGRSLDRLQRLFLFSRADTIYGGSDEIQRNVIGERALALPREPR